MDKQSLKMDVLTPPIDKKKSAVRKKLGLQLRLKVAPDFLNRSLHGIRRRMTPTDGIPGLSDDTEFSISSAKQKPNLDQSKQSLLSASLHGRQCKELWAELKEAHSAAKLLRSEKDELLQDLQGLKEENEYLASELEIVNQRNRILTASTSEMQKNLEDLHEELRSTKQILQKINNSTTPSENCHQSCCKFCDRNLEQIAVEVTPEWPTYFLAA